MTSNSNSRSEEDDEPGNTDGESSGTAREIRLAKVAVVRTGHGVAMDVTAGKLRFRLYIDAQWSDLVQTIAAGEGELDQFVPFRMSPLEVEGKTREVTPESLGARRIPELSSDHPLYGTPLWNAIFPSEEPPAPELGFGSEKKGPPSDEADGDSA